MSLVHRVTLAFFLICFSLNAEAHFDRTHIIFTNHSAEPITLQTSLLTTDEKFTEGSQWGKEAVVLQPYESKRVLWFVRNIGVKLNQAYQFRVTVNSAAHATPLEFDFDMKANPTYGSTLASHWKQGNASDLPHDWLLVNNQVDVATVEGAGSSVTLYAKTWRPSLQLFNDYQIVIDADHGLTPWESSPDHLSVLTYNTQMMPLIAGAVDRLNQPDVRVTVIPSTIATFDVVVMQELFDKDLRETMVKGMSATYPYHTVVVGEHSEKMLTGGVMIFSRWPITYEKDWVYIAGSGLDDLAAKGVAYAVINKLGKRYHVFGTHLEAGVSDSFEQVRVQQLREMSHFISDQNIPDTEPVIMAGDFNIDRDSREADPMKQTLQALPLASHGFEYSMDPNTNTMTTDTVRSRIDFIFPQLGHRLPSSAYDRVFVNRAFKIGELWPRFDLSDHYPVAAYFQYD